MNDDDAWILLNQLTYLNTRLTEKVLQAFDGDPQGVFCAKKACLEALFGPVTAEKIAKKITHLFDSRVLESIRASMTEQGIRLILRGSSEYPSLLKEIYDPPVLLYALGKTLSKDYWGFAMVGSRKASEYGKRLAYEHARILAREGISVVSGLARGIDTFAHRGACFEKGHTVAVLGSGLARIYPKENIPLSRSVFEQGTLLSEYPPLAAPLARHFPFRNRIISGLSKGVLVVEASQKSGSLITASSALDQDRLVFAIPARPKDRSFEGCNRLIQMGAKMVLKPEDITEEFHFVPPAMLPKPNISFPEDEKIIFDLLEDEPLHMDQLTELCDSLNAQQFSYALLKLEIKKQLKRLPGNYVCKRIDSQ